MVIEAWPSCSWMTRIGAPDVSIMVATPWRRSWTRMCGSPAALSSSGKAWLTVCPESRLFVLGPRNTGSLSSVRASDRSAATASSLIGTALGVVLLLRTTTYRLSRSTSPQSRPHASPSRMPDPSSSRTTAS
jgi:hypothetical protein